MKKTTLHRRTLLRSSLLGLGAAVALPPLEAMFDANGTALADGTPIPLRYGVFFWGNGVRPDRWRPGRVGAEWWLDPNEELAPLAASTVRDRVSVLTGFDCQQGGVGHHSGRAQMLTGTYDVNNGTYGGATGPSSDFLVADAWEGATRLRSIDVGISSTGKASSRVGGQVSWNGSGRSAGVELDPSALYDRLFGMGFGEETAAGLEAARRRGVVRQSMVDVVREDAERLRDRLGAEDRRRIEAHLDGLRGVERQIASLGAASTCVAPDRPSRPWTDEGGRELLTEKNQVVADLLAIALACDVSRVFTYQLNGMQADTVFWQVGGEQGAHVQTHDDRGLPEGETLAPQFERVHLSVVFIMEQLTTLLEALDRIPEGDGTVLDHSAIYATSEVADGTRHTIDDMPIVVAGGAGGALVPGMHYRASGGANATDVPLTLMRAVGVDAASFGAGESASTRHVSELLT